MNFCCPPSEFAFCMQYADHHIFYTSRTNQVCTLVFFLYTTGVQILFWAFYYGARGSRNILSCFFFVHHGRSRKVRKDFLWCLLCSTGVFKMEPSEKNGKPLYKSASQWIFLYYNGSGRWQIGQSTGVGAPASMYMVISNILIMRNSLFF